MVRSRVLSASAIVLLGLAPWAAEAQARRETKPTVAMSVEVLAPQPLPKGSCGLFLWARGGEPRFVFVAYDEPAEARMRINGRNLTFDRTDFNGAPQSGHFENQTFEGGDLVVEARLLWDEERGVRDGALVREGALRLKDKQGWETLVPVAGMTACQR